MGLQNHYHGVGYCGCTPQLRTNADGSMIAKVPIYTENVFRGKTYKEIHWCVFFGSDAKRADELLMKGSQVHISGFIHYHKYTDKTGQAKSLTQIIVDEFLLTKAMFTKEVYKRIYGDNDNILSNNTGDNKDGRNIPLQQD